MKSAMILKARFRAQIDAVALTINAEEGVIFLSPAALEEAAGYTMKVADIIMLAGGTVHYDTQSVAAGDSFSWTGRADDEQHIADKPLVINNVQGITFNDVSRSLYFNEHCVAKASDEEYEASKAKRAAKREELANGGAKQVAKPVDPAIQTLISLIKSRNKIAELRTDLEAYDEFDSVRAAAATITSVPKMKALMLGAITSVSDPF